MLKYPLSHTQRMEGDQGNLERFVKTSKTALKLSGIENDKEIFKIILGSFTEKSREFIKAKGLVEGEFAFYDLEEALDTSIKMTLEEELAVPQKAYESVGVYLKRMKSLLPQFGEDAPSVGEFQVIFEKGIHSQLKESVKTTILDQMKRLSRRNLKEFIEQLDGALKVITESSRDRILKPQFTCFIHPKSTNPFELDGLEDACDDLTD